MTREMALAFEKWWALHQEWDRAISDDVMASEAFEKGASYGAAHEREACRQAAQSVAAEYIAGPPLKGEVGIRCWAISKAMLDAIRARGQE